MLARLYPQVAISKQMTTQQPQIRKFPFKRKAKRRPTRQKKTENPDALETHNLPCIGCCLCVAIFPTKVYLREHSNRNGGSRLRDDRPLLECKGWHACKISKIRQNLCSTLETKAWLATGKVESNTLFRNIALGSESSSAHKPNRQC